MMTDELERLYRRDELLHSELQKSIDRTSKLREDITQNYDKIIKLEKKGRNGGGNKAQAPGKVQ